MMICYHVKKRHKGSSCRFELLADEWRGSLLRRLTFCGYFLNLFDCRCVFAYLLFLFNECVTKERLALSHIQLNPCFTDTHLVRTPHYYGQVSLSFKPLYGHFLWPPQGPYLKWFDCTENAKFTTSAWLKSINFNKIWLLSTFTVAFVNKLCRWSY